MQLQPLRAKRTLAIRIGLQLPLHLTSSIQMPHRRPCPLSCYLSMPEHCSTNARDHPVRGVILTLKTHLIANLGASLCSSRELRAELGVYTISVRSCKLFLGSSTPSNRSPLTSTRSGRNPPHLRSIVPAERCRSATRASFAIYFSKSVSCINVDSAAREIE